MTLGGRGRVGAPAVVGAMVVALTSAVVTAGPVHADQDLLQKGSARYVVSDTGAPVKVTQQVTLTNRRPSTATYYYYLEGYKLWLPSGATHLSATSNGSSIPASVGALNGQDYASIRFPSPLRYGQSRTITVAYTIPGAAPRSSRPARVGKGYAALDVFSPGDAGQATVEVVSPRWMTIDLGVDHTEETTGDTRVATISGGGPAGLWSMLSLRDPSQAVKHSVRVDDHTFSVVGFPGDTRWSAYVAKQLPPAVRELERLTGQAWPTPNTTVTEDFSRQVYGWDGVYERGAIDISEALDPSLLTHELAHAWANHDNLDERWLVEGLAQELTTRAVPALKAKDAARKRVTPGQKGAVRLTDWAATGDVAGKVEDYAYPASWTAVHELVEGSTTSSRPELFKALTSRGTPYDVAGEKTLLTHGTTWRQAYDLFEVVGGNRRTRQVMSRWVVDAKTAEVLAARTAARKAYAAADQRDGAWSPPRGVRAAMADWDFTASGRALALTHDLAGQAAAAQRAAARYGVDAKVLRAAYQGADDTSEYREVGARLSAFTRQVEAYGDQRTAAASSNPLARLGGLAVSPAGQLRAAEAALEKGDPAAAGGALEAARSRAARATWVGVGLVAGVLLLLVGGAALLARRSRRRSAAAPAQVAAAAGTGPAEGGHDAAPEGELTPTP